MAEFEGKFQGLLKRAKYYDIFSDSSSEDPPENPPEALNSLIPLRFWMLSSESQVMLFQYLFFFEYKMEDVGQWLFDKQMNSSSAAKVWYLLHRLFRPELSALLQGNETAAFEWMTTPDILNCLDQSIQNEAMLRTIKMITSTEKAAPPELGKMDFEFRPGERKTMQEWLDEELQQNTTDIRN